MRRLSNILLVLLVMILSSCDLTIHEYPDVVVRPVTTPIRLDLEFDVEMPEYQTIEHKSSRGGSVEELFDIRYVVNVYHASRHRQVSGEQVGQYIFTKEELDTWNYSVELELEKGFYDFIVWADFVNKGSASDKYYTTYDFSYIASLGNYSGSNDYRDAFIGYTEADLTLPDAPSTYTVDMSRPLSKYRFVSNDLDTFISRMLALKLKQLEEANRGKEDDENRGSGDDDTKGDTKVEIDLADYYVVFSYPDYVNTSYNALLNVPGAPSHKISFRSSINKISETEAEIGFDYIFVGADTKVSVSLEIFENSGEKVGGVEKFFVPLSRSKLTTVIGGFLTSQESGGVGIDPGFDDDFTIEID